MRPHLIPLRALVGAGVIAAVLSTGGSAGALASPTRRAPQGSASSQRQPFIAAGGGDSYGLLTSTGALLAYGAAFGAPTPAKSFGVAVAVAPTGDGQGAYVAYADGAVSTLGDAVFHGSAEGPGLEGRVVGIAVDGRTGGYWLATDSGDVYAFDAPDLGSAIKLHLRAPMVSISAVPAGGGYRLAASDGGVFCFGDARYAGSAATLKLNKPIVGMATTPSGAGYWLVASDGGIFAYGGAPFRGSAGAIHLNAPIVSMASTADGRGYWLAAADGGVFSYGDARYYGSAATLGKTIVGIALETGGYVNPLRAISGLQPQRVDQGVDYGGGGPIYAIGDGVVLNTTNAGWPGGAFITYQLSDGRAKGCIVYVAENVVPKVKIGQQVTPDTVLGEMINESPYLETGWAAPPGTGQSMASADGDWSVYDDEHEIPSIFGANFSQLLEALGAPPGHLYAKPDGKLPTGWPIWTAG